MHNTGPAVTELLQSWQDGNRAALDQIVDQLYSQLRAVAGQQLGGERPGHTLAATALVHEAYLRLQANAKVHFVDRKHFLAIASRAMRCILVDYARGRKRLKRDGGQQVTLEEFTAVSNSTHDLLAINTALEKLASFDPRKLQLLELISFAGATYAEAAAVLDISEATVHRDLKLARAWLKNELKGEGA